MEHARYSWCACVCVGWQVGAERHVSFDHGPDGSVAEDMYFALVGAGLGYSFGFVHGDMWEKSPFTASDYLQQRKRWLQGLLLVVHSRRIQLRSGSWFSFLCVALQPHRL